MRRLLLLMVDGLLAALLVLLLSEGDTHECDLYCQVAPFVAAALLAAFLYFTFRAFR